MKIKEALVQTRLICPKCKNKVEIFRKENKQKKKIKNSKIIAKKRQL